MLCNWDAFKCCHQPHLIQQSAGKMSCDFNQRGKQIIMLNTHLPPHPIKLQAAPSHAAVEPTHPPHLLLAPPSLLHSHPHSPFLPPCLMALLLPQPMGPADLSLAEPPPFSSLIGRGGRGRGHGGGEALPGPPLHAGQTWASKHRYTNTGKQTQIPPKKHRPRRHEKAN